MNGIILLVLASGLALAQVRRPREAPAKPDATCLPAFMQRQPHMLLPLCQGQAAAHAKHRTQRVWGSLPRDASTFFHVL